MKVDQKNGHVKILILLTMFLLLAVVRTNYGLWNADIPLGDEAGAVDQAFRLYKSGNLSANLYNDAYIAIFRFVTDDPIMAYYWVRFLTSLASVIGLFLLLTSINGVNLYGAFVMALMWNISLLNTPLIQYKNIHLFAFMLSCFAGFFWMTRLGKIAKAVSLAILLVLIFVRPEYAVLLFLLGLQRSTLWLHTLRQTEWSGKKTFQACLAIGVGGILIVAFFASGWANRVFSYVDGYLFYSFKQCYNMFFVVRGGLGTDPMTEFDVALNKNFPGATGFFDALRMNPAEVGKYFLLNGISNVCRLSYLFANQSIFLPNGLETYYSIFPMQKFTGYQVVIFERILFLLLIGFGSIWLIIHALKKYNLRRLWRDDRVIFIFSLAAVSMTPLLLLIAQPMYWIMLIPLFFWGPAALISKYSMRLDQKVLPLLSVLLSLIMISPIFISSLSGGVHQDKEVVLDLRDRLSAQDKKYFNVLGYYPHMLLTFAIPGRWEQTTNMDVRAGSTYESLIKTKKFDLLVIDQNLQRTQQYNIEKPFFEKLLQRPETFGYALTLKSEGRQGPIRIFERSIHSLHGPIIHFGLRGNAAQYQLEGWSRSEGGFTWTDGGHAALMVPIVKPQSDLMMTAYVSFPFLVPGKLEKQRVTVGINGKTAGQWVVSAPGEYRIRIPQDYIAGAELRIAFVLPDAASPAALGVSADSRKLGLAMKAIKFFEDR